MRIMTGKKLKTAALILLLFCFFKTAAVMAEDSVGEIIDNSRSILNEFSSQQDVEMMVKLLENARGVAIFPRVIKVGFMVGGRYGQGLLLKHNTGDNSWSGPYFMEMKGLSYGLQIGVQSIALVLVITNEEGMENLQEGTITLGGDISIAAGPVGRSTEAATDLEMEAAIYSYSMSKGAFAGMSLEGAEIEGDDTANINYWDEDISAAEALKRRADDQRIIPLLEELEKLLGNNVIISVAS